MKRTIILVMSMLALAGTSITTLSQVNETKDYSEVRMELHDAAKEQGEGLASLPEIETDAHLKITMEPSVSKYGTVTLENSIFRIVIGTRSGDKRCPQDSSSQLSRFVIKSCNQDQVGVGNIEGGAIIGHFRSMKITVDSLTRKTVHLEYDGCPADSQNTVMSEYTIFPNSPVIRHDHLLYGGNNGWYNIFDCANPGGSETFDSSEIKIYGSDKWIRGFIYHDQPGEKGYYDQTDYASQSPDPHIPDQVDGGSLSYHGYFIMAIASKTTKTGFGRVIPIYNAKQDKGGVGILKILRYNGGGFECFPGWGQNKRPPFSSYLFCFTNGLDSAINMGKKIADGDMLIGWD
jgi:hypothetical protein